jgi:hypothetical protein
LPALQPAAESLPFDIGGTNRAAITAPIETP